MFDVSNSSGAGAGRESPRDSAPGTDRAPGMTSASILELISAVEFLRSLSPESLGQIAAAAEVMALPSGATLIRQGEQGDAMYVVVSGTLRALIQRSYGDAVEVGRIGPGDPVGELQFISGGMRGANVEALSDCVLLRVRSSVLDGLPAQAMRTLSASPIVRRRLLKSELAFVLPKVFGPVAPGILEEIEQQIEWVHLDRGEALFRQGEPGDGWYLILSGRLRVMATDPASGVETATAELGRGDHLGEIALLTGDMRDSTPYAIRDSLLVRFPVKAFENIMERNPRVLLSICRTLVRQNQGAAASAAAQNRLVITVTPGADCAMAAPFARALVSALGAIGTALHIDAQTLHRELRLDAAAEYPADHPSWYRFTAWLEEQQNQYDFIVLETDAGPTAWTRRALGQADHVVVVADAGADKALGRIEAQMLRDGSNSAHRSRRTLVLVHDEATELPSGTRQWLALREVDSHLHIRAGRKEDVERVARSITGRAVGLTLGGGGARGFAHLGVVKALRELGIPIDVIGGTSMGAIMAGQIATGRTLEQLYELNRRVIALKPFSEYTIPMFAMLKTKRIAASAVMAFGDTEIEDLWLPYFAVSSNLTTADLVVHDTGMVWKATRASGSLPGIAVPFVSGDHLLVDGGLINNLPGDVMRSKCGAGPVIAVNVSPDEELGIGDEGFPSPWKMFWNRVLPFRKRLMVPSVLDILMRATMLASANRTAQVQRGVDLYLRPPIDSYGMLEFDKLEEFVDVGYRYTMAAAAHWQPGKR